MKKYLNLFDFSQKVNYRNEVLSGLTVALALVPEAVAFALIAGLSPLTGLYAAFVMGLVTSILGGRPGMISGATGAVAVVIVSLALSHGVEYIFATAILAGIIQVLAGLLRLGKLMRLVPHPVIFGFVNGLAIIIFMSQLDQFKDPTGSWLTGDSLFILLGLVFLTMLIIWGLPKLTKAIPASLTAILVVFGIVAILGIDTKTVGDIASIQGGFPPFHIPDVPFTWETLTIIFPYAAIVAGVGLIESLLTLNIIDEITETRGRGNKEAVAQGTANMLSGLFSGMGGCAMIGQNGPQLPMDDFRAKLALAEHLLDTDPLAAAVHAHACLASEDSDLSARAAYVAGSASHQTGHLEEARPLLAQARSGFLALDQADCALKAMIGLGRVNRDLGRFEDATVHFTEAFHLARAQNDQRSQVDALNLQASVLSAQGDDQRALEFLERALQHARLDSGCRTDPGGAVGRGLFHIGHGHEILIDYIFGFNISSLFIFHFPRIDHLVKFLYRQTQGGIGQTSPP